jgi:hypothetical protein
LGCVERERERKREREREKKWAEPTWPCERGRKRPAWAGPQGEKKIGKRKRESGPDPIRKRERKRNAFKCI